MKHASAHPQSFYQIRHLNSSRVKCNCENGSLGSLYIRSSFANMHKVHILSVYRFASLYTLACKREHRYTPRKGVPLRGVDVSNTKGNKEQEFAPLYADLSIGVFSKFWNAAKHLFVCQKQQQQKQENKKNNAHRLACTSENRLLMLGELFCSGSITYKLGSAYCCNQSRPIWKLSDHWTNRAALPWCTHVKWGSLTRARFYKAERLDMHGTARPLLRAERLAVFSRWFLGCL